MSNLTLLSDDQAEALAGGFFFFAAPLFLAGNFSYSTVKADTNVVSYQNSSNNSQSAFLAIAGAIQNNNVQVFTTTTANSSATTV